MGLGEADFRCFGGHFVCHPFEFIAKQPDDGQWRLISKGSRRRSAPAPGSGWDVQTVVSSHITKWALSDKWRVGSGDAPSLATRHHSALSTSHSALFARPPSLAGVSDGGPGAAQPDSSETRAPGSSPALASTEAGVAARDV
jgi:hypothetical protein